MMKKQSHKLFALLLTLCAVLVLLPGGAMAKEGDPIDPTEYTININVEKEWNDAGAPAGSRPSSVTLKLMNGNHVESTVTLTSNEKWEGQFSNVSPYTANGVLKTFTVVEEGVSNEYTPNLPTFIPKPIDMVGLWDKTPNCNNATYDIGNPDLLLGKMVIQGGTTHFIVWTEEYLSDAAKAAIMSSLGDAEQNLTTENTTFIFSNDAHFDGTDGRTTISKAPNGTYQIHFEKTKLWSMFYTGMFAVEPISLTVTNTYTPVVKPETSVSVRKVWNDNNNQDGIRPESISVYLLKNGSKIEPPVTLSESNGWFYTWNHLDAKNADGTNVTYSVQEDTVEGYNAPVLTGDMMQGFTLTNTHTPATTSVSGKKTWVGDTSNTHPASITVNLLKNGTFYEKKVVTADDGWKWNWTDLPEFDKGIRIVYTITEDAVTDYTTEIKDFDIINTYTPSIPVTTSVKVTKVWEDDNNAANKRPDSVTVDLFANNTYYQTVQLNADNKWTHTFTNLDASKTYTVKETNKSSNYTDAVTGNAKGGFIITNTYTTLTPTPTSNTVKISGVKIWDDGDDRDGLRPGSIKVTLLADGKAVESKTVTSETDWAWSFTANKFDADGNPIVYTVEEAPVPGYETSVSGNMQDGFTITNTHKPKPVAAPDLPQTGDNSGLMTWLALLAISCGGLIALAVRSKKHA